MIYVETIETNGSTYEKTLREMPKGDCTYTHEQSTTATKWTIAHNLNKYPNVTIVDTARTMVIAQIKYIDANNIELDFKAATAGFAYLN